MKNKYITYEQYNNQINKYNQAIKQGFKPVIKKNLIKIGLGIVFYPLSFYLLGFSLMDLEEVKRKIKNKIRGLKG